MFPFQQPSWDFIPASSPSLESYLTRNRKEEKKIKLPTTDKYFTNERSQLSDFNI